MMKRCKRPDRVMGREGGMRNKEGTRIPWDQGVLASKGVSLWNSFYGYLRSSGIGQEAVLLSLAAMILGTARGRASSQVLHQPP